MNVCSSTPTDSLTLQTPTEGPTIRFSSDTDHAALVQTPQFKLSPTRPGNCELYIEIKQSLHDCKELGHLWHRLLDKNV